MTSLDLLAWALARLARFALALLLALCAGFGFDGLLHYVLKDALNDALGGCSAHSFSARLTIWSEAFSRLAQALAASLMCARQPTPLRSVRS